jgi:hypothetical protein
VFTENHNILIESSEETFGIIRDVYLNNVDFLKLTPKVYHNFTTFVKKLLETQCAYIDLYANSTFRWRNVTISIDPYNKLEMSLFKKILPQYYEGIVRNTYVMKFPEDVLNS